jgi:hypothetical protein
MIGPGMLGFAGATSVLPRTGKYLAQLHGNETEHTLIGASSSRRIGCEMKISRALVQRNLISCSRSCTCLPGLLPRTSNSLSIIESKSTSFSLAIVATKRGQMRVRRGCGRGGRKKASACPSPSPPVSAALFSSCCCKGV